MNRAELLHNDETLRLINETEYCRQYTEDLINKEFTGKMLLRKFARYRNLLEMTDTKIETGGERLKIVIRGFPQYPQAGIHSFLQARRILVVRWRKWRKLHARMMREAEPYLVAEEL